MQLLDADYLARWETHHAPALQDALEKRRETAQQFEADALAKASSAIISGVMRWMREGFTKAEAAAKLPVDHHRRVWGYSYTDLLNILPGLGVSREDYRAACRAVAEIDRKAFFAPKGGAA